ncbi:MAG: hypothetical protein HYX51_09675 [Chloroflexi bacterium]|nr:hypothetical protein [Chloroflexota bacterium]
MIKAQYGFRQDDGLIHAGDGQIRLAALSPANGNLPSLLGWDVLRRFRLTTDWDTCEVLLEPK